MSEDFGNSGEINTARLKLRRFTEADRTDFVGFSTDPEVNQYIGGRVESERQQTRCLIRSNRFITACSANGILKFGLLNLKEEQLVLLNLSRPKTRNRMNLKLCI